MEENTETRPRKESSSMEKLEKIIEDTRKLSKDMYTLEDNIDDLCSGTPCFAGLWKVLKKLLDCIMCKK
jgi:hypothetical protein